MWMDVLEQSAMVSLLFYIVFGVGAVLTIMGFAECLFQARKKPETPRRYSTDELFNQTLAKYKI